MLNRLQASGCQFDRNGSWYSGDEAKAHLLRKLDYLEGRTSLKSTEQFVDLAATGSSVSGAPYHVRCAGAPAVESRKWLQDELASLRTGRGVRR